MTMLPRLAAVLLLGTVGACAGSVHLPGQPGGGAADVSSQQDRNDWLDDHPNTPPDIRAAIEEGVFVEGMTLEHRDVISNPDRRGTTGNGYWRSRDLGDEIRYEWYVANERQPFDYASGRAVCELVYRANLLAEIRYCSAVPAP